MNYYITTSIPYVNGDPHIGHALELLYADVLARAARKAGKNTLFSTGTDEHGGKIAEKAEEAGITPKQWADEKSLKFRNLSELLNLSNDRFIRTTDAGHEQRAQLIWKELQKDIYKDSYEGLYCTGCEAFVTEAAAKENNHRCPDHDRDYEKIKEENYFFKLSNYSDRIQQAIENEALRIVPKTRKHEILNVIKDGLEDISISRPKDKITWGVPVPGDKKQVMYVWFEALMNYITVLGYPEAEDYKTFWPADVQVIGKDIIRFHAAIWPGILLSLGQPLPKNLYVHGFITVDNQKMSKSIGNVVSPQEIVDHYGIDGFRYFFTRHISSYSDGDFSWEKMHAAHNGELANELGNTVQRTAAMIAQYLNGDVRPLVESAHDQAEYWKALENFRFDRALDAVWNQVRGLNQYIDEEKPWEVNKQGDTAHVREILAYQVSSLLGIADLLEPFLPETSHAIKELFGDGTGIKPGKPLFPRIEHAPTT